jgi:hypothetical protein
LSGFIGIVERNDSGAQRTTSTRMTWLPGSLVKTRPS